MPKLHEVAAARRAGSRPELTNLNVCAPFVVPGARGITPSNDCFSAVQSIQHDCLCNTLRIASRLPAMCQPPPLTCDI
ncbi:hypothetical protein MLD38_019836 [Melastoma candidum]|uniref:Uncharacterized protein n=1 Tax=Melastoma candidum TaxID=119954 RepID=A0ACB9QBG8_9MYRT|nr:hypothetical protein MLD38_019836 [Melastoma candidum]